MEIERIVEEYTSDCTTREQKLVAIFEKVRDIPYGTLGSASRDPLEVYRNNRGTCSGKHFLLRDLLLSLDIKVKDMVCFHYYSQMPRSIDYPPQLMQLLEDNKGVPDYHNYLQVYNGDWLTVDATFDYPLKDYFVVNEWDGKTDTRLSVKPVEMWEVDDAENFKMYLLNKLPPDVQKGRKRFLQKFSEWLEVLRRQ
ncbi:MAG: transglutaminase domain-containing protein [Candidatus Hadarchaeota archaeon]